MMPFTKYSVARATGIPALANFLNRNRLLVLSYHGIHDGSVPLDALPETFVFITEFARELEAIRKRYHIIDASDLRSLLTEGTILPPQSVLITFDDGYESFHRLAQPVLESLSIKAVVFVSTRFVEEQAPFWFDFVWALVMNCETKWIKDLVASLSFGDYRGGRKGLAMRALARLKRMPPNERDEVIHGMVSRVEVRSLEHEKLVKCFLPMTKGQIRTLSDRGVTFGGHTHTHTILSALSQEQAEEEIILNKRLLESVTKWPCDLFAYPNGGAGDFHDGHKDFLKAQGFVAAFTLTQGRSCPKEDPMGISRLNVAPEDRPESLLFRCTGITPVVNWFRTRLS